jgi:hypothetical protein
VFDPETKLPIAYAPRQVLKEAVAKLGE